jgi:hypothetical protein
MKKHVKYFSQKFKNFFKIVFTRVLYGRISAENNGTIAEEDAIIFSKLSIVMTAF